MQDLINSGFELGAGLLLWINVYKLYKDKKVRGVHVAPTFLFASWGLWNIYFYSSLGLNFSFLAGIVVFFANITWVSQMIYYNAKEKDK